jgi:hypothetical protein
MRFASNITVSPLAQAKAVKDPAIGEVIDLDTGEFVDTVQFISGYLFQAVVEQRVEILARMMAGNPHYVCATCHVPVYLVSRPEEHIFFFRHRHEDGSCPAQTRSALSEQEIRARKYHGLRESEPHKRVKALILRSLDADAAFSDVRTERNWRSDKNAAAYRRPDVQADHASGRLAFEVQLSTTFLSVVVGRREFYRQEGALLVWVFAGFDPDYRLLTTNDLLFSNNSNVFVVDDETALRSEQTGIFHLRCHYRRPLRDGDSVSDCWKERIAPFHELLQDRERQRAYLFDYSTAEARLREEIAEERRQRIAEAEASDRNDFQEFWLAHGRHFKHTPENRAAWQDLREQFAARGIALPDFPDSDDEMTAMLNALYSVRGGLPVVWKFTKLVQIAHLLAENHPRQLAAFGHAVKIYKRENQLNEEDNSRKWRNRVAGGNGSLGLSERMHAFDPELRPDPALLPMTRLLFPEVALKVEAYLAKAAANDETWD